MNAREANFDGLVGPTHNYAGLSYGNVASVSNKASVANPREAALQGLTKAKALADLGFTQGILAPQERPNVEILRRLGFTGSDAQVLQAVFKASPELLASASSASSMWTANAATVCPSADASDGKVHFTPANLANKFHRALEHETTGRILRATFHDEKHFVHHPALPAAGAFGDEGAANHTRFCADYGQPGVQLFVYGRAGFATDQTEPKKYPARQTLEASQAVARLHGLTPERTIFAQQSPAAIDAGAFHNDVVSVGNRDTFFYHEDAFVNAGELLRVLKQVFHTTCGRELKCTPVSNKEVPLQDAIKSYLFNSQLLALPDGKTCLVAPTECLETESVSRYLASTQMELRYFDLRQSMRNGGGPACLRLRVVLNDQELSRTNPNTLLNDALFTKLTAWVGKHYRDRLTLEDLTDPKMIQESHTALDELTQIMKLGSVYPFQKTS